MMTGRLAVLCRVLPVLFLAPSLRAEGLTIPDSFQRSQLVAWCIVPFDAKKRDARERSEMLVRLGLRRSAYDWRQEHVSRFEREMREYEKRGIEFFAFWKGHPAAYALFEKYGIRPQIWMTVPSPPAGASGDRVAAAVQRLLPHVQRAANLGCRFGLYNHGGWGGQPENLVAICEALRADGHDHAGIVYNFHHAHDRIADFPAALALMKPYLLCLNLNGMIDPAAPDYQKILPIGSGDHEAGMIEAVIRSGYDGPIGILGHVGNRDVEQVLSENLTGLEAILAALEAGP